MAKKDAARASYDVVIIGAGIVGSAIARELSGRSLTVALIEGCDDVGDGTSKANTAILHTGFDATPGTLESRLVSRGYELLGDYALQIGIPVERTGAILVAWNDEERDALPSLKDKAGRNGYRKCEIIDAEQVYRAVPALGPGVLAGLTVPDESIICTWTTNLALATDAVRRGTNLTLKFEVDTVEVDTEGTTLRAGDREIRGRWIVNAAGLGADYIDQMFGHSRFAITPRRGELFVFDKLARPLVNKIVLPVPTSRGKGVLVSPTIYGNVMLGPTAEDLNDRSDTSTSEDGFDYLVGKGESLMPALLREEVTATYAGLRAASERSDYIIELDEAQHYLVVAGIRSTGLTAGMAIAEHVTEILHNGGLTADIRTDLPDPPRMPNIGEVGIRPYQDAERIVADPEYGRVVCFCERVTAGEIRDAMCSTIPPAAIEGLRRRTRAVNGRCQGFFCAAEVGRLVGNDYSTIEQGESGG